MNRISDLGAFTHGTLRREEGESEDRYDSSIVFTFFFSEGRNYLKGYEHVSILVRLFRGVFVIVNVRGFLGDE